MLALAALMYVLTGGSSVGKTSIITELEKQGEPVIHEAATDYIKSVIEKGVNAFWEEDGLGFHILQLQLEREKPFLEAEGRVFIDRGIFDNHSYVMHYNLAGTKALADTNAALEGIDLNQRYAAVFLISPYQVDFVPTPAEVRKETAKEIGELQAALYAIYGRHRNFIVVPGEMTPRERADFILEHIARMEALH